MNIFQTIFVLDEILTVLVPVFLDQSQKKHILFHIGWLKNQNLKKNEKHKEIRI